jgi:RNA polymerase sigma-70 factor (ECF subfamily)
MHTDLAAPDRRTSLVELRTPEFSPSAKLDLDSALEDYRRELAGYCYRMLGSPHEAEDAVQDTLLRAWRSLETFEGRAALRSWLYRIATNVCLTMLDGRRRRALPMDLQSASPPVATLGVALGDNAWIQPIPDGLALRSDGDPADVVVARETIRLAFIAALQQLPPRQRAVLILRDVLRWRAAEVAELLDTTVASVNGLLRRARAALASRDLTAPGPLQRTQRDQELLARYVEAFERLDIDNLVSLLRDDAVFSMPPFALWLQGRSSIHDWLLASDCRDALLLAVEANGSPAFGVYKPADSRPGLEAFSIQVLELSATGIAAIHSFLDPSLFELFDLPLTLPERPGQPHRGADRTAT